MTPRKLTISGNEFVLIAMCVFSSFISIHKLFKDKFTWKSQYLLSLDYKHKKSEPNSPVAPTWRNVIDVTSNRARQLWWMCGLCMKQRHSITHAVQRGKTETYGPKFLFLASIYRFVCGYILCIVHKWNLLVWSYKMSGETFWSGVWFSHKKDFKMGCKNQNCHQCAPCHANQISWPRVTPLLNSSWLIEIPVPT
jgi:hypothetical protein